MITSETLSLLTARTTEHKCKSYAYSISLLYLFVYSLIPCPNYITTLLKIFHLTLKSKRKILTAANDERLYYKTHERIIMLHKLIIYMICS